MTMTTWLQKVARGRVKGVTPIGASGKRSVSAQGVNIDIWPGPDLQQPIPSGPMQVTAVSSSADDSAAGSGVQRLEMHYLDGNDLPQVTQKDTNGTAAVTFDPTDVTFIQCVHAVAVGSNGRAVGDIDIKNGGTVYKRITAGANRCRSTMRKAPAYKNLMVGQLTAGGATQAECLISEEATALDGELVEGVFLVQSEIVLEDGTATLPLGLPQRFPPLTIVTLRVATDKEATVTGTWSGWLEPASWSK